MHSWQVQKGLEYNSIDNTFKDAFKSANNLAKAVNDVSLVDY